MHSEPPRPSKHRLSCQSCAWTVCRPPPPAMLADGDHAFEDIGLEDGAAEEQGSKGTPHKQSRRSPFGGRRCAGRRSPKRSRSPSQRRGGGARGGKWATPKKVHQWSTQSKAGTRLSKRKKFCRAFATMKKFDDFLLTHGVCLTCKRALDNLQNFAKRQGQEEWFKDAVQRESWLQELIRNYQKRCPENAGKGRGKFVIA